MANEFGAWRMRQAGVFVPETVEVTRWDQFLGKLGLTEREALDAINRGGDVGSSIRRFVLDSSHDHFIPEDVLLAVNLRRDDAKARLMLARFAGATPLGRADRESSVNLEPIS